MGYCQRCGAPHDPGGWCGRDASPQDVLRKHVWWPVNGHYLCACGWTGTKPREHVVDAVLGRLGVRVDWRPRRRWSVRRVGDSWGVFDRGVWADVFPTLVEAHTWATQCAVAAEVYQPGGLTRCKELVDAR